MSRRRPRSPVRRWAELTAGWLALIATPFVGALPGPGGVFVFAFGATLVLRNSAAARRWWVRMVRRWPKLRRPSDLALRRRRRTGRRIDLARTPSVERPEAVAPRGERPCTLMNRSDVRGPIR